MKFFSMFTGIGGFELGIEQAHREIRRGTQETVHDTILGDAMFEKFEEQFENWRGQRPQLVGFSEIDKRAISIFKYHFPEAKNYGDCTRIDPATIPDIDVLVGGFPCQAFSIAGQRRGFDDTRGTLFYEVARIARSKRPRLMVLENVKGLLNHDQGKTFSVILNTLGELGYEYQWGLVNSRYFGVPQNRERVVIVANLGGTPRPEVFPLTTGGGTHTYEIAEVTGNRQGMRAYLADGCGPTLAAHAGGLTRDRCVTVNVGDTTLTARCDDRGFFQRQLMKQTMLIRRLTPIECERLQGFPDDWTKYGVDETGNVVEISDSQRYKCLGNAVTVNVFAAVFGKIFE